MLPATLLSAVEAHKCFTGCYRYESPVAICTDAAMPLSHAVQASCADCLSHYVGALARLLPPGMTGHALASELSAHMRAVRGYRWALSGYHTAGGGFWLSAASLTESLFLVDGSRNYSKKGTDAELLVEALKHNLAPHQDPRMLDPALYTVDYVHLDLTTPLPPVKSKNDVLTAPQCSPAPRQGARRVAVLEFTPLGATSGVAVAGPSATSAPAAVSAVSGTGILAGAIAAAGASASATHASNSASVQRPPKLRPGDLCPVCNAEYKERPLFTGSFVGCLC